MALEKTGEIRWNDAIHQTEVWGDRTDIQNLILKTLYLEKLTQATLAFSATDDSDDPKTALISTMSNLVTGMSQEFEVTVPTWTNDVTMSFRILNPAGKIIYSLTGIPRSSDPLVILVERPLFAGSSIQCVLAGAPGGSGGNVLINGTVLRNGS